MTKKKIPKTNVRAVNVFRHMVENGYEIVPTDSLPGRSLAKQCPHLRMSRAFCLAVLRHYGDQFCEGLVGMHGQSLVLSGPNNQTGEAVRVFLQTGGLMTETALRKIQYRTGLNFGK